MTCLLLRHLLRKGHHINFLFHIAGLCVDIQDAEAVAGGHRVALIRHDVLLRGLPIAPVYAYGAAAVIAAVATSSMAWQSVGDL